MNASIDEEFTSFTKPIGLPPGTLCIPPGSPPPVIDVVVYDDGGGERHRVSAPEEILSYVDTSRTLWVDVNGLGSADVLEKIGNLFQFHRLSMEDVTNLTQRPKIDDYQSYMYVVAQYPVFDQDLGFEQISIFWGDGFVITFESTPTRRLEAVFERIAKGKGMIRKYGSDYLAYAILDGVVDAYFPFLEKFDLDLERIQEEMFNVRNYNPLREVFHIKHILVEMRRAMWGTRDALNALIRDGHALLKPHTLPYLKDTLDHSMRILEIGETQREQCASLLDYHYALLSQRMNEVMKILTIITTIFIPLSFIVGLYGMNFDRAASSWNMPELGAKYGYPVVLATMAVITVAMVFFFRRKGWLGKE